MSDSETLWEKPIAVFGYNDAIDLFGGWLFEAETNCIEEHNMGQVASSGKVYIRTVSTLTCLINGHARLFISEKNCTLPVF